MSRKKLVPYFFIVDDKDKTIVNLRLRHTKINDVDNHMDKDGYAIDCSLRDISILFEQACGCGVMWNLAYEISRRMGISYDETVIAIEDIVREYSKLSEEEGLNKFYKKPKPSYKYFDENFLTALKDRIRIDWWSLKNWFLRG